VLQGQGKSIADAVRQIGVTQQTYYRWRKEYGGMVISPFLTGCIRRTYAAIFSFMAGVMPPMPMFGRSLLYVQSHCVA